MELNDFIVNFADAIDGVEAKSLTPETDFNNNIKQWDSLSIMTVLAMLDSEYEVVISGSDLESCKDIQQLFELVKDQKEA